MEVYVEYVIIDNLIINYLLLKVSIYLARIKSSNLKLIISSVVGTAVAVIMPLIKMPNLALIFIKILLGVSMVLITLIGESISKFPQVFGFFIMFTALCGGVIIMIFYFAGVDYKIYFSLNYNSFIPIGITILIIFVISRLTIKWVVSLFKLRDVRPFIRKCVVISNGKKVVTNGFIDSGNRLIDVDSGLPIIVASASLSTKLEKSGVFKNPIKSITFSTVSGNSRGAVFLVDKLMVYNGLSMNIYKQVLVARSLVEFEKGGEYEILLSPTMF